MIKCFKSWLWVSALFDLNSVILVKAKRYLSLNTSAIHSTCSVGLAEAESIRFGFRFGN